MYFLPIGDKNLVVSHHIECCRNDVRLVTAAANNAMLHLPPNCQKADIFFVLQNSLIEIRVSSTRNEDKIN